MTSYQKLWHQNKKNEIKVFSLQQEIKELKRKIQNKKQSVHVTQLSFRPRVKPVETPKVAQNAPNGLKKAFLGSIVKRIA